MTDMAPLQRDLSFMAVGRRAWRPTGLRPIGIQARMIESHGSRMSGEGRFESLVTISLVLASELEPEVEVPDIVTGSCQF